MSPHILREINVHLSQVAFHAWVVLSTQLSQPSGWHVQHSTIQPQRGVRIWWTFVAKSAFEIFSVVGTQPKFALVDTFSHASRKNRQNVCKRSTFPTT
jgi:hypothetical protein